MPKANTNKFAVTITLRPEYCDVCWQTQYEVTYPLLLFGLARIDNLVIDYTIHPELTKLKNIHYHLYFVTTNVQTCVFTKQMIFNALNSNIFGFIQVKALKSPDDVNKWINYINKNPIHLETPNYFDKLYESLTYEQ